MIPILYDKTETAFTSNGLGRLYDITECTVTEERNGIYECSFSYPVTGAHFDEIVPGQIIGVTHDGTDDVQPFDIVSVSRPIGGVVTFHAVHISYRLSKMVATGSNINSLQDALDLLTTATPDSLFAYSTDQGDESGYMAAADGTPRTVRQLLGGVEGSILDTYGGEYEFDKFNVTLWNERGITRDFTIRYGVNLVDYNEDTDYSESYTAVIPYWTGRGTNGADVTVIGDVVDLGNVSYTGRTECIPLDLKDKFQTQPTTAQLETEALKRIRSAYLPKQSIKVDFIQLADTPEYAEYAPLMQCRLCDQIPVMLPMYGVSANFKIVKTVYNVLLDRFDSLELGELSTTLSQALGIASTLGSTTAGGETSGSVVAYEDYTFTVTYTAGTVGTRGAELTANGAKTGYDPISATVIQGNTYYSSYVARVATGGIVTLSAYRATTGARTGDAVTVRVAYLKQ